MPDLYFPKAKQNKKVIFLPKKQSPQSCLKTLKSLMVHEITSLGHGAKRKRSVDDQGQTAKRQKTGARWVLSLGNITEFTFPSNNHKVVYEQNNWRYSHWK